MKPFLLGVFVVTCYNMIEHSIGHDLCGVIVDLLIAFFLDLLIAFFLVLICAIVHTIIRRFL